MSEGHYIFIKIAASDEVVSIPTNHHHSKVYLAGYSIKGSPVTGSVPDSPFVNVFFDGTNVKANNWIRNDNISGSFPILVTGSHTSQYLSPPMMLSNSYNANLSRFRVKVTDNANAAATFTELLLILYVI